MALGHGTEASGLFSTATGRETRATNYYTTVGGYASEASGYASTAFGFESKAAGSYSTAMGLRASAQGDNSTAMGWEARALGKDSIAIGKGVLAIGENSMGISLSPLTLEVARDNTLSIAANSVGIGFEEPVRKMTVDGYVLSRSGSLANGTVACRQGISTDYDNNTFTCHEPRVRYMKPSAENVTNRRLMDRRREWSAACLAFNGWAKDATSQTTVTHDYVARFQLSVNEWSDQTCGPLGCDVVDDLVCNLYQDETN